MVRKEGRRSAVFGNIRPFCQVEGQKKALTVSHEGFDPKGRG